MAMQRATATFEFELDHDTVERTTELLTHFEYVYNLYALFHAAREGYRFPRDQLMRALRSQEFWGVQQTNHVVRGLLVPEAHLRTTSILSHSPLQVTFDGLAKVVESLVSLFDPIRWMERWEDLRHKQATNREAERRDQLETIEKEVKTIRGLKDLEQELAEAYRYEASPAELEYIAHAARAAAVQLVHALLERGVKVKALKAPK